MSFDLFGFDFIPDDGVYGFWFWTVKRWKSGAHNSALCIHYSEGDWRFELIGFRIV